MNIPLRMLGTIPVRWRWGALAVALLLIGFGGWFFFFRAAPGGQPTAQPPQRPALGRTITYEQYTSAVDAALADVRAARSLSREEREKKLESAAGSLERVEGARVAAPGAAVSPAEVDNTAIIKELREDDPNLEAIESSLAALAESLREAGQLGATSGTLAGEAAIAEMREVLSDPLFDYERELSPLERLARWLASITGQADPGDTLWRWITSLVAALAAGTLAYLASDRLGNRPARLGLAAGAGLFVGILFYAATEDLDITQRVLGAIGFLVAAIAAAIILAGVHRSSAPSRPRSISELAATLGMGAGEARKRAEEAAAAGDYRLAIRYRCLAVLLALDEVGKLAFDRAATDREYLFRAPGGLQEELQPLLTHFEAVWYGDTPATAEDWGDYTARAGRLEARAAAEARAERQATRVRRSAA